LEIKSTRKFIVLVAVMVLFITITLSQYHPAYATSSTGIMIPLYTYPTDGTWTTVINVKNEHPSVPFVVIADISSSGAGTSIDQNFVTGINNMKAAGITVLGYVDTAYGSRSMSQVQTEINNWSNWYHVNGIFFDEMNNAAGGETYYSTASSYAKSLGMTMTVGNPGTSTLSTYVGTVDNIVIYESTELPSLSTLLSYTFNSIYPKSDFSFIAYSVSSLPISSYLASASNDVAYLYITNAGGSNPYDVLPSYFSTEVADLDTGSTATVPSTPSGLTAITVSSSQINLSWTAPSNNGGSAITGYQIQRSTDGGSTWSTIISNTVSTSTTYSDTGLVAGTTYTYQVSAINSVGTGSPSNSAFATTSDNTTATVPSAPTGLVAKSIGHSKVSLSWTVPSNNGGSPITEYQITISTDNSTFLTLATFGADSTTFTATGLHPHTTYYFQVFAINFVGTSLASNTATTKT